METETLVTGLAAFTGAFTGVLVAVTVTLRERAKNQADIYHRIDPSPIRPEPKR